MVHRNVSNVLVLNIYFALLITFQNYKTFEHIFISIYQTIIPSKITYKKNNDDILVAYYVTGNVFNQAF